MAALRSFLLPVYAPTVLLATALFAILPGLPDYLGSIGAPLAIVGTVVALRGVGTLAADLPAGVLLAQAGSRRIMLIAAAVLCLAMTLLALVPLLLPTAAGILCIGAALASFFLGMQSHVRSATVPEQRGKALSGMGGSLRIGALIGPAVGGVITARFGMQVTFATSAGLGLGVETIGWVMSAGALFDLLLFVPAGLIMDRRGRKVAASLCLGIISVGFALLPFTGGLFGFAAVAALIGVGNGLGAGINLTLGANLAPAERPGHFLELWRIFGDAGATLGPNLVGVLAALFALPAAIGGVAALGLVGTGIMLFAAPETGRPAGRRAHPDAVDG